MVRVGQVCFSMLTLRFLVRLDARIYIGPFNFIHWNSDYSFGFGCYHVSICIISHSAIKPLVSIPKWSSEAGLKWHNFLFSRICYQGSVDINKKWFTKVRIIIYYLVPLEIHGIQLWSLQNLFKVFSKCPDPMKKSLCDTFSVFVSVSERLTFWNNWQHWQFQGK